VLAFFNKKCKMEVIEFSINSKIVNFCGMYFKVITVILPVFLIFETEAQRNQIEKQRATYLEQPNRIEFDVEPEDQDYIIVPAEDRGLVIFKETYERGDRGFYWEFNHVDTLLEKRWTKRILLPYGSYFMGHDHSLNNVYILLGTTRLAVCP